MPGLLHCADRHGVHIALHQICRYGSTDVPSHFREPMFQIAVQPQIVTSARMAAGMTSRARRPEPCKPAG